MPAALGLADDQLPSLGLTTLGCHDDCGSQRSTSSRLLSMRDYDMIELNISWESLFVAGWSLLDWYLESSTRQNRWTVDVAPAEG